jgi:hypothetical protein
MEFDLDITDLRQMKLSRIQLETRLRICYAVIATFSFESRISGVLSGFDSSEECFEGKFYSQNHVLKSQRMDFFELRAIYLQLRQSILSLKTLDLSLLILPSILPIC